MVIAIYIVLHNYRVAQKNYTFSIQSSLVITAPSGGCRYNEFSGGAAITDTFEKEDIGWPFMFFDFSLGIPAWSFGGKTFGGCRYNEFPGGAVITRLDCILFVLLWLKKWSKINFGFRNGPNLFFYSKFEHNYFLRWGFLHEFGTGFFSKWAI